MSIKIFTEKEVKVLSKNKYVKKVSIKGITYTDEYKRIFIVENEKGKSIKEIFKEHRFDIDVLGNDRIRSAAYRWLTAYRKKGIVGLNDTRKLMCGRSSVKDLPIEERYKHLKVQFNLLKAENELLKKIDILERRLIKKK
ncbi:hypothetical protein KTC96_00430 [Clostridium estertheticum]|uniref:HTH domain-containing protein n=1 Tax=Clostridium estertheticum TaxID=238834 RepID=UPI001C7D4FA9|nr:HTH domain-containing protein [Clostridium estertheticum]MBX4259627.1 hypothetical protein [Clostridium estertheticum]WLC70547.1 hypothetical protein KTC96_00430 [Clostridium estertheticum]